ncbi:thiamine monophosphate kinase [Methylobrevis pamukkalensis]|uniref:Thiamine monophosphate kinase n=1 Tax=Methylobrevis pamukkalensis TaxID=1439726 RepID=A0A1E3GXL5_9HYPH|nr:thiamine monophosphate kinase [Methylobrevis pamukkalensis]
MAIAADPALRTVALTGGDDYELALACRPEAFAALVAAGQAAGIPVTAIGRASKGEGLVVMGADGGQLDFASGSFSHF